MPSICDRVNSSAMIETGRRQKYHGFQFVNDVLSGGDRPDETNAGAGHDVVFTEAADNIAAGQVAGAA